MEKLSQIYCTEKPPSTSLKKKTDLASNMVSIVIETIEV